LEQKFARNFSRTQKSKHDSDICTLKAGHRASRTTVQGDCWISSEPMWPLVCNVGFSPSCVVKTTTFFYQILLCVIFEFFVSFISIISNAAFTLNHFDNQEGRLILLRKRISKFWNSNFMLAV